VASLCVWEKRNKRDEWWRQLHLEQGWSGLSRGGLVGLGKLERGWARWAGWATWQTISSFILFPFPFPFFSYSYSAVDNFVNMQKNT
jgi:hypothetical protein